MIPQQSLEYEDSFKLPGGPGGPAMATPPPPPSSPPPLPAQYSLVALQYSVRANV